MKMRFNKVVRAFLAYLFAFWIIGCGTDKDNRRVVAVSIEPLRNVLENIAGDKFRIVTVMPGNDNPETFEPSPSRRIDLEKGEVCFVTGLLPFETKLMESSDVRDRFVNVSKDVDLMYGTHSHEHGSGKSKHIHTVTSADPHIWSSVKNMEIIARNMSDRLCEIDPENAEAYRSNLNTYLQRLDSIDNSFGLRLKEAGNPSFLMWHPSLTYFARDYGLEQISVSPESKEMSVSSISRVIDKASADSIGVMFYQREYDSRQSDIVGRSINARMVPFSPVSYDWEAELNTIVDELTK